MSRRLLAVLLSVFFLFCAGSRAFGYQRVNTSLGEVVIGLDKDEAVREFGVPQEAGENLWRYRGENNFFVYFKPAYLVSIQLYPRFSEVSLGSPLELKAYGYFSDFKIKDITDKVQIIINRKWDFNFSKSGVAIPLRTGKYQALAKYDEILSNPCQITVTEPVEETGGENERCLGINLIPFNPVANPNTSVSFKAFGTFYNKLEDTYFIRDITPQSQWFLDDASGTRQVKDNAIQFGPRRGKAYVFCRYRGTESFPQAVSLVTSPVSERMVLKHITALPEMATIITGKYISLKAFGTYENNDIRDINKRVRWRLSNKGVLVDSGGRGEFFGAFEGICEVYAELEGVRSAASKIVVKFPTPPKGKAQPISRVDPPQEKEKEEEPPEEKNLLKDIKSDAEKLVKDMLGKEKKLKSIRIEPASFNIAVGESAEASAWGVYDDYSEEDLTTLAEWRPASEKLFSVEQGRITAYMPGETELYAKFKGLTSTPAKVKIEGPKLISIVVYPPNSTLSMLQKADLSAEGYFSDSSRKYITEMVSWGIEGPRIIRINKAVVYPLKFGRTKAYAQYAQIKSLPVNIRVLFSWGWLVFFLLNAISLVLLAAASVFAVFYLFTLRKKKELKALLEDDPRSFAVKLYDNSRELLEIFGFHQKEILPPLAYASLVDMRYTLNFYYCEALGLKKDAPLDEVKKKYHELALIYHPDKAGPGEAEKAALKFKEINEAYLALSNPRSNRTFFNFTQRFEEAKYSKHSFERGEALLMLSEYNYFINILSSHYSNCGLIYGYCLSLLKRKPLRI